MRKTFLLLLTAISLSAAAQRERISMDDQWQFALGHASDYNKDYMAGTEYFNYLTKANSIHNEAPYVLKFKPGNEWKSVDLPHDWAVDLPFNGSASYSHGFKQVGWKYPETSVGWYRKTFHLPESDRGRHVRLQFDGIFRNAQVWVNGFLVGQEPSGYASQDYDITDYLLYGNGEKQTNLICVRVDASLEEGWFYEGAGIYRHVWMEKMASLHIATDGTFAHFTLNDNFTEAQMTLETEVVNDGNKPISSYSVQHALIAPNGDVVATMTNEGKALAPREMAITKSETKVKNPALWSLETPQLYKVRTRIIVNGQMVDEHIIRTGIRDIKLDADKGLFLNGKHVTLKGVDCHQDHAGVGAGIPDGLQAYRIERLKWMGVNAYRASHNPMTPALLDVCDSLGILVYEENRLMGINPFQLDVLKGMIHRDRNHPSVFCWSVGNEEWGIEWEDRGEQIAATMTAYAHQADPTRPVSVASASGPHILRGVDVAGYNYIKQHHIDEDRQRYPKRIALGSEETTGCGTRGVYAPCDKSTGRMPSMNYTLLPSDSVHFATEYGWNFYHDRPWLLGVFYWTGFDYRGEPVPLGYPATGSQFGLLDYCGFPKDEAYYLKAWWTDEPMVHILPHWNLQGHEGEAVRVQVFSNCDKVELIVNGKKMGRKPMPRNGHLEWTATYKPGSIQAIGYNKGKKTATERLETTSEATHAKAAVSRHADIHVLDISLLDKKERLVPTASVPVTIRIEGNARIVGGGNGDSAFTGMERPTDATAKTFRMSSFNGHAQLILQSPDGDFTYDISVE